MKMRSSLIESASVSEIQADKALRVPFFDTLKFKQDIVNEVKELTKTFEPVEHADMLNLLLTQIDKVDFREQAAFKHQSDKLGKKHYLVSGIEQVLKLAQENNWGICKNQNLVYLYNGAYWNPIDNAEFEAFLGDAAEKMGIDKFDARLYTFREQFFKQFMAVANLPKPPQSREVVLINFKNGTFEIVHDKQFLRTPERKDFLTYQLPFAYNPKAKAPMFDKYLNMVQPDVSRQMILAEYLGYLFVKPSRLKLEKTLLLYGTGANGKSVFFEIVNALLGGDKNVSSYSLQNLTNENGYYRAMLGSKLLNYASEINGKLETSIFKQLVSGEPVDARLPYGEPFTLHNYAKLIFNCNELPREVEQSLAYFRRFLIIAFDVTIPEADQDKELSKKIIDHELSGVFNWVLDGLRRLLLQKGFTKSESVDNQIENYKLLSDNVKLFLNDEGFANDTVDFMEFKEFFNYYRTYCTDGGYHACSKRTFAERLRNTGFITERRNYGLVIFVKKVSF